MPIFTEVNLIKFAYLDQQVFGWSLGGINSSKATEVVLGLWGCRKQSDNISIILTENVKVPVS